jgi:hypothetical protein
MSAFAGCGHGGLHALGGNGPQPAARTAPKGQRNPSPIATPIVPGQRGGRTQIRWALCLGEWYIEMRSKQITLTGSCAKTPTHRGSPLPENGSPMPSAGAIFNLESGITSLSPEPRVSAFAPAFWEGTL